MNNYVREAFGTSDSDHDPHAALKLVLGLLMMDDKVDRLTSLLARHAIGVGGDPGWELERRNPAPPVATAYAAWPAWATYRAYVDPDGYRLGHPESFYDERTFAGYVGAALAVYGRHRPGEMAAVAHLLALLPKRPAEAESGMA